MSTKRIGKTIKEFLALALYRCPRSRKKPKTRLPTQSWQVFLNKVHRRQILWLWHSNARMITRIPPGALLRLENTTRDLRTSLGQLNIPLRLRHHRVGLSH